MTMVNGKLIGATHPERVEMVATLVDVTGKAAVGYVTSLAGELVRPVPITPGTDGVWSADLTANALITSQSGDTLWAVQEGRAKDGTPVITYIAVPETGGPYWVGAILADLSTVQTGDSTILYLAGPSGTDGASAYQVAVANGFVGSEAEWLASLVGPKGDPGSGAVSSVNTLTGDVVLDAARVGADPAGAASAAQSAAATDATSKVAAHTTASDPHGDRAAAAAALSAHESDTIGVHGITDTAALETTSGAQAKADAAQSAATTAAASDATAKVDAHVAASDPHGDRAAASTALAAHESDTTSVHGIADTTLLETASGAQAKADAAQTAATSAAATDATAKVSAHTSATDPHGDRAYADTAKLAKAANLSDLANAGTARGNLGLGGASVLGVGTSAGTVAAGDDSRITGAAQKASNLSDLASASTARSNLGLGGAALLNVGTSAGTVAAGDDARIAGALPATGGTISGNLVVTGNALGADSPAGHGVAAWAYDPALAVNSTQLTAGTLYLVRVNIAAAVNITKVYWWVANTGSGAVASQNLVGLYDSTGTLLASANVDASFSTATLKTTTITGTALSAGAFYWVGLLFNASVTPTLTRASGWTGVDAAANLGLTAVTYRFAKNGTGRTSMPSSITPGSNVGSDIAGPWVAVGA